MRRPVEPVAPGISLFPFLAVLLCTMGALIVVLVVLNRHSRMHAEAVSAEGKKAQASKLAAMRASAEQRRDDLNWQIGHLRESRDKTQTDLDRERLRLSGIEEHRRQLEAKLREIQQALAQFDNPQSANSAQEEVEVAQLKKQVEQARADLEKARLDAAGRAQAYSVVPYDGPYRTRRRPIYIECTSDRVVIQPEGIELTSADFSGPMGPGNPLASAVRAARDHLAALAADPKSTDGEPYPLFLVRPDGIEAYYAARAAMQSWGADFGYQTIDRDWKLEFPPSDSGLAHVEQQAVAEARERLQWLAQASPDRYGPGGELRDSGEKVSYRVSPLGGLIREGGPSLHGRSTLHGASRGTSGRFASTGRSSSTAESSSVGSAQSGRSASASREARSTGPGRASLHPASDNKAEPTGSSSERELGEHRVGEHGDGEVGATQPAAGTADGSFSKFSERRYGDLNDRRSSSAGGSGESGSNEPTSQAADAGADVKFRQKPNEKPRSLAETRGANWGLPPTARASNPITRPIHMVCEGDKLMILAEKPDDPPVLVPLRLRTEESIDQLVMAVQERIRDWGIAGRGLYWRPQLILAVGHSGEGRFTDLEALLADSGFDVKRR
jgi:hypothetical protein